LAHGDFLDVVIQKVAFEIKSRTTNNGDVEFKLPDCVGGKVAHQSSICAAKLTASDQNLAFSIMGENIGHIHVIRHHHQVFMLHQLFGDRFGRSADIKEYRYIVWNFGRAGFGDGAFGLCIEGAAFVISDIYCARW